jgi:hypothetical protein
MKSKRKVILAATLILGTMSILSAGSLSQFIAEIRDNDLIKSLKQKLQAFIEARQPERVYVHHLAASLSPQRNGFEAFDSKRCASY